MRHFALGKFNVGPECDGSRRSEALPPASDVSPHEVKFRHPEMKLRGAK